ncbi:MAG TPA: hypothetical protein DCX95_01110 [Elusimicrobia bacterium]|nr:hypothetical protein [Elusimicrobiota bacterium]
MAKGLSDKQKTILKVIGEKPEGKEHSVTGLLSELKGVLYPELYRGQRYFNARYYGIRTKEKNVARVIISKAITRLINRGLLIKTNRKHLSGHNDGTYYQYETLMVTPKGRLIIKIFPMDRPLTNKNTDNEIIETIKQY